MPTYRLDVGKITGAIGTGYVTAFTAAAGGTTLGRMVATCATAQNPGGTYRVGVFLYNGATYAELDAFTLNNVGDSVQWESPFPNITLPSSSWSVVFALRGPASKITDNCEIHLLVSGVDVTAVDTVRVVTAAGAITHVVTDQVIVVNKGVGAATTVNLMAAPPTGQKIVVKDGKGDAGANNITITPNAGTIDGSGTLVVSTNFQAKTLVYNGTQWNTVATS
jgi:hypothetical protein